MGTGLEIPATFELAYPGDVELVPVVRRFLFDLCNKAVPKAPELASRVALASYELLDNAARHGTRRDAALRFEILGMEPTVLVRVSVANSLTLGQLQTLSSEVEKVRLAPDGEAYYRDLQRAAGAGKVGMGLARIRAEAGLEVYLGVHGSRATVFAQSPELMGAAPAKPPSRPVISTVDLARPISHGMLEPARPPSYAGLPPVRPTTPTNPPGAAPPVSPATPAASFPVAPKAEPKK